MRTLALVLTLIGVPALFGAFGFAQSQGIPIAPSLQKLSPQLTHVLVSILAFCYSLSALGCAYAAWRSQPWVRQAYSMFVASVALFFGLFIYITPIPRDTFSFIVGPIFFGLVALGLWKGWRVIGAASPKV